MTNTMLLAVAIFWILAGAFSVLIPRKLIISERILLRRLRLISIKASNRPITRWSIILICTSGAILVIAGTFLIFQLLQMDFQIAFLFPDGNGSSTGAGLKAEVDRVVQPLINSNSNIGVAVGILREGKNYVFGYGRVALDSERPPDGETLFELGSITKAFTALTLARMVEEGVVKLDDPIRIFLSDLVEVPAYGEKEITLLNLATHTSGLPRLPGNMITYENIVNLDFVRNPYADYTAEQLHEFVSEYFLQSEPGKKYLYSNLGMGLLGYILARKAEMEYERLLIKYICAPLGMSDTRISLSPELQSRLARGYSSQGLPLVSFRVIEKAKNWDMPTLAGAGAVRSTVNNLLKFISANLGLTETELTPAMENTHAARIRINKRLCVGMGWHISLAEGMDKPIVWHNGGTGGYSSYLGFVKERRVGLVILSNTASSVDEAGVRLLRFLNRASQK